jgi:hypothetical protein
MAPREVFLSHAHRDRVFAARLAETLQRQAVPVWYSPIRLQGAQQWHDEIGKALGRCDWFVLVLSPAAVRSEWVKRELFYALQKRRYRQRIVPLLYKACKYERLSWTLGSIQRIDFSRDFDGACRDLLRVRGIGYERVPPMSSARSRRHR